jgi:hypothetical protein
MKSLFAALAVLVLVSICWVNHWENEDGGEEGFSVETVGESASVIKSNDSLSILKYKKWYYITNKKLTNKDTVVFKENAGGFQEAVLNGDSAVLFFYGGKYSENEVHGVFEGVAR